MAQAAFTFDDPFAHTAVATVPRRVRADTLTGKDRAGFDIGWDHAHYRLTPPTAYLNQGHPVRQGWDAGRAAYGRRTLTPTAAVRQWLALRLGAFTEGSHFEDIAVTPHHIARLAASHCPVTRQPMSHGSGRPEDALIDRLHEPAGHAAGNLICWSRRARQAAAGLDAAAALAIARRLGEPGPDGQPAGAQHLGLGAAEWLRLAVLKSYVRPLPHAVLAGLPLVALPTPRLRLVNAAQSLAVMLTLQFTQPGHAQRLPALAALAPAGEVRQTLQIFLHTLLARRLASGVADGDAPGLHRALEDAWGDPLVQQRWSRLALRLGPAACETLVAQAARRGLGRGGWRWLPASQVRDGWAAAEANGREGDADARATEAGWPALRRLTAPKAASTLALALTHRAAQGRPTAHAPMACA